MKGFPLQNKKLQRCSLPYLVTGTCEVMNNSSHYFMDSFYAFNSKNRKLFSQNSEAFNAGDIFSSGLVDSYTGQEASSSISRSLSRAMSCHTRVPEELRSLKKEFPDDPLFDIMSFALEQRRSMQGHAPSPNAPPSLVTKWDMEQYALHADAELRQLCLREEADQQREGRDRVQENGSTRLCLADQGCRAVWFAASPTLEREDAEGKWRPHFTGLDVCVSCLGSSRAFGLSLGGRGQDAKKYPRLSEIVVPLSMDHHPLREEEYRRIVAAGGSVDSRDGNIIDGNPYYTVSRSFGHFSMKNNLQRPPSEQKIISVPTTKSWRMGVGDVLVLCNQGVFDCRGNEKTTVDEIAKEIIREIDSGSNPEEVASSVCNFAMRFGASHSLQVTILMTTNNPSINSQAQEASTKNASIYKEWVQPGPIYAELCRQHTPYCEALLRDCKRCNVSLSELLFLRWKEVRDTLPDRYNLPLRKLYGYECSALQQCMDEEASLFSEVGFENEVLSDEDTLRLRTSNIFSALAKRLEKSL